MPTITARRICSDAFVELGVYQPGETLPADVAQDALRRLNYLASSWAIQTLTIPVIAREVFPITANVGTYTIGPGGDFDTTRPASLSGAGLLLNSGGTPSTVSSLTSSGNIATATVASHGYASGQNVTIAGASPTAYNGTFAITVTGTNTFTYVFAGGTSPATGTITALPEQTGNTVVEIPRALLTDDAWEAIQIKSLTNPLFTDVYYNPTFLGGLGTIQLWPIPTTAANSLVLYRPQQLSSFSTLDTSYDTPDGYAEAFIYNLALRLAKPYTGLVPSPDLVDLARSALGWVKRSNVKLTDLPQDPAVTHDRRGGYNIQTGLGG